MVVACNDDDPLTESGITGGDTTEETTTGGETTTGSTTTDYTDFSTFSIEQSNAATGETATSPTARAQSVTINFNTDGTAEVTDGDASLVTISGQAVTASTADVNYILTGSTAEGSSAAFNCKAKADFTVTLNGVNINTTAKAIGASKGGNVALVLADGTVNTITCTAKKAIEVGDDTEGEEVYSKLDIYGAGVLNLEADAKGAISSTDAMTINPGVVLNVTIGSDAVGKKGLKSDTSIEFKGGRTTVINNAAAEYDTTEADYSAATCVKAPKITVSGGTVQCKATGNGGKGIRADESLTVNDGTVQVITSGKNLVWVNSADKVVELSQLDSYSSYEDANPKGIHVGDKDAGTGNIYINGGKVTVKAENSEGIESKMYIDITGGTVEAYAGDDAINAGISKQNNPSSAYGDKGKITISGGTVYAYSTTNDAIDANGTIYITGGTVIACGNTGAECGIDCDDNTFSIKGGYIISMGGSNISKPTESACTQSSLITTASTTQGQTFTVQVGGSTAMTLTAPRTYQSGTFIISTPEMQKGSTYAITSGTNSVASGTLSTSAYVNGSAGGMGGGSMPGGNTPGGGGMGPGGRW